MNSGVGGTVGVGGIVGVGDGIGVSVGGIVKIGVTTCAMSAVGEGTAAGAPVFDIPHAPTTSMGASANNARTDRFQRHDAGKEFENSLARTMLKEVAGTSL